jgi:tetratricopeptide (TPR) repeat protein
MPTSVHLPDRLVRICIEMRDAKRAEEYIQQSLKIFGKTWQTMKMAGRLAMYEQDYSMAIHDFQEALKDNPHDMESLMLLGESLSEVVVPEKLKLIVTLLQDNRPTNPDYLLNLAEFELSLGQLQQSRETFQEAGRKIKTYLEAHIGLARIAFRSGETRRSIQLLEKVEAEMPENQMRGQLKLARAFKEIGEKKKYDALIEKLYQQFQGELPVEIAYADHLRASGHIYEACALLDKSMINFPKSYHVRKRIKEWACPHDAL